MGKNDGRRQMDRENDVQGPKSFEDKTSSGRNVPSSYLGICGALILCRVFPYSQIPETPLRTASHVGL